MGTLAGMIVTALADLGVRQVWGVVGDALNPLTDAIRTEERLEWIGVRHEEAAAFAAGAQSQLSGVLGVCMGTVGPGSIHLLNGLYDAKKSRTPVLAICGQVPSAEIGSGFFQEVNNDQLFADVAVFCKTVTSPGQLPYLLEQAVNAARTLSGVAVLSIPGDIGSQPADSDVRPHFVDVRRRQSPEPDAVAVAAQALNGAGAVTMLVGMGAREARTQVLAAARALQAPMVLTLKAKEGLEKDNDFQVGQSGLIGNPAALHALDSCDVLLMVGTDFPYREWLPEGKVVVQLDVRGENIGARINVDHGVVGDAALALDLLLPLLRDGRDGGHLAGARRKYVDWTAEQARLAAPGYEATLTGRLRAAVDNPQERIRPEAVAAAVNAHADQDAIFTSDTGMSTVWLSRFVAMDGDRRLLGSYNLGSMANAMPQALGAAALDKSRQVVAFCGDGGLTMLLGDLLTAVAYDLPVKLVVFNNGRLGMVKLEQEEVGLPEFGTVLHNPDLAAVAGSCGLHAVRVEAAEELDAAISAALAHPGPVLLDILTNPDEVSLPPKTTLRQAFGFAAAKIKETLGPAD
ncbi:MULTISPECIES: thiamine pyrophosphate-dependent enzyme [unclassified Arthrobacter]|uniref:thiamine pyrophosphate-dependent enzyme n=1 Tax=unclassified Arthrobacter TaxID=235627 RepID=UPI00159DF29D|nr:MULTISPECIES: thiamine pyrophosphate-dependent enzyme [unclassified Arthrobacter]MCQ9162559.1 thiamine pyrophosphate-dependent enzyme [Arthrobacter sp. STN4]NVM98353.1 pyruvate oxidase [Arthrobacter sp. SDTb3-6]